MMQVEFLKSSHKFFSYYKERAMSQLEENQLFLEPSEGGNSIYARENQSLRTSAFSYLCYHYAL
jgi:hypothetical protein